MTKLSHCPSIVVISSDGTRFELPDSAAAYSSLIRLAVAQWSAVHAPSSASDDDDRWGEDDDDDDSTVTDLHAAIGGTPNHMDDLTYASSRTRSSITQDDSFEERGLLNQTPAAGRDMVRVDAIIGEDRSSSTDSSTPDHGTLTEDLLQDDALQSEHIVPEGGAAAPSVEKVSHDSTSPESSSCTRPTPSDGEGNREMSSEINEATPETLPLENVGLPRGDGDPKAASQSSRRAEPSPHEVSPRSSLRPTRIVAYAPHEDSPWRDGSSLDGQEGREESAAADTGGAIPRSTAHSRLYNGEFYASSSGADATPTPLEATVTDPHPPPFLPQGIESVEWVSPTSLHQRTPVMLGDDDELVIVRGDGPEETLHLSGYRSASPCHAVHSSSSTPTTTNGHRSPENSPRNDHARFAKASPPRECSTDPVPPNGGTFPPTGLNATGETLSGACITATAILIDLGSSKGGELRESPGTSSTTQEPGSSPNAVTSTQVSSSHAVQAPSTSSCRRPSDSGGLHAPAAIVQICISYLLHFCAVSSTLTPTGERAERGSSHHLNLNPRNDTPTVLPAPLTGPLYTFLSPWELHYLYVVILHYDASILDLVKVADRLDINYTFPAGALAGVDDKTRQVLVLPAPSREGVQRLKEVMAAAQGLGIPTLRELCTAWMADFMIRASYGAADYLEAAHIIRQCFRIQADWTRKETDTLKLENEWPANEEDS